MHARRLRRAHTDRRKEHRAGCPARTAANRSRRFLHRLDSRHASRQVAKHSESPLSYDPFGNLGNDAQHTGDAAVIVIGTGL